MSYDVYFERRFQQAGADETVTVFERNHTSNTAPMWRKAGCDLAEFDGKTGADLRPAVARAISAITTNPETYLPMEPANGWGSVPSTVRFLADIWEACLEYPEATVHVSR